MVYTGLPSAGCATCKKRKKKCDRTKPACKQCLSVGRECPGIPDEVDLIFRNTTVTTTKSKQSRKPRAKAIATLLQVPIENPGIVKTAEIHLSGRSGSPVCITTLPLPSLLDFGVYHFFRNAEPELALQPRRNPFDGLLSYIYSQSGHDSPLHHAVAAAATMRLAYLSRPINPTRFGELAHQSEIAYGNAIRALGRALKDPSKATSNEVLLATHTLMILEPRRRIQGGRERADIHFRAATDLLTRRDKELSADLVSDKVVRGLQLHLDTYKAIPMLEQQWRKEQKDIWVSAPNADQAATNDAIGEAFVVEALRSQASQLGPSTPVAVLYSVTEQARQSDRRLENCATMWRRHLSWDVHSTSPNQTQRIWVNCPPFFSLALLTTYYYLIRLHLLTVRAEAYFHILGQKDMFRHATLQKTTVSLINQMVNDICMNITCFSKTKLPSGATYLSYKHTFTQETGILLPTHLSYNIIWITDEQRVLLLSHLLRLKEHVELLDAACCTDEATQIPAHDAGDHLLANT